MAPPRGSKRGPDSAGTPGPRPEEGCAQAWIELSTHDAEAMSALAVARARLGEGRGLASLRRLRLFELRGPLPARADIEGLLHRSTWFYNPHKERCTLRTAAREPVPAVAGEQAVLVVERGGERCTAAERWWLHETGQAVEVRAGLAWLLRFEPGEDAPARAAELAVVSGRSRGLLCNPNAQDHALAPAARVPLPWIGSEGERPGGSRARKRGTS